MSSKLPVAPQSVLLDPDLMGESTSSCHMEAPEGFMTSDRF